MRLLSERAVLSCDHQLGIVGSIASQSLVRIDGAPVLVERDPPGRPIVGCPNVGPGIKPCLLTLAVAEGLSELVRVEGLRVALGSVEGDTDGTPPGAVRYRVRDPGQDLVKEGG